ncbi:MAG: peptidylprolyl isomerase [Eubacteriales bacterium]|nr:peptidylprolyl isomerase [Eubacteriales bacterium]
MKKIITLLLALAMVLGLLTGCAETAAPTEATVPTTAAAAAVPGETAPPDGNPDDVTCKGSYTGPLGTKAVARVGSETLTPGVLQAAYWAQVEQFRRGTWEETPDFDKPLDVQPCPLDEDVASWQQYFLKRALDTWHTAQALALQSQEVPMATEEAYKPDPEKHAEYMTDMPANRVLYGNNKFYVPNSMHQAFLDGLPALLKDLAENRGYGNADAMADKAFGTTLADLTAFAELYNRSYMYFTTLSYDLEPEVQETAGETKFVDIRQILLYPQVEQNPWQPVENPETPQIGADGTVTCSEELWQSGMAVAEKLLNEWRYGIRAGEATFAELANQHSQDRGTAVNGGSYRDLQPGQLDPALDEWCFDPERKPGDTTVIRTDYGIHILYFSGSSDGSDKSAMNTAQQALLRSAREQYPMEVDYAAISLKEAQSRVALEDMLYPDVAHERYPEVPLYVQQDYPDTKYGGYPLRTHGCGITTMAMLASYMADEELTPPELSQRYGSYCSEHGTDGTLFNKTPAEMGFFLLKKTYKPDEAKQALEDGYIVVSVQTKGFWTRGGHYLLIEKMNEDGTIQVRDSNLFNYGRLPDHKNDRFEWETIPPKCVGYWIFQNKIKTIPACTRCGDGSGLAENYICEKCQSALARRGTYLNGTDTLA